MAQSKWEKTKVYSKKGFDKAWHTLDKLGPPINRLSNKVGAEAFWPTSLDVESDKAARILQSFCKEGFYEKTVDEVEENEERKPATGVPRGKQRVLKKIPASVIKNAKGLAIFTTMRTGLWVSGSGGSGVLLGRNEETGEWGPPSGIMTHTMGLGFLAGIDIYDCVVVINTYEALESFKAVRCTLGGEVGAAVGPVGAGGVVDSEVHKRQALVWTYLKGRGFFAGIQIEGTIIIERSDENERFYGERISARDILAGKAKNTPASVTPLMETIRAAQGDSDVDEELLLPSGEAPGDIELNLEGTFGIPDSEDPDPFGVRALEREGLLIREAGSRRIPGMDVFEFRPSPSSPLSSTRWSLSGSRRSSIRNSIQSLSSLDKGTQTDDLPEHPSSRSSVSGASARSLRDITSTLHNTIPETDGGAQFDAPEIGARVDQGSQVASFTKARLVTIPKRPPPPPLPPRNPVRESPPVSPQIDGGMLSTTTTEDEDASVLELRRQLQLFDSNQSEESQKTEGPENNRGLYREWNEDHGALTEVDDFHSAPDSPMRPQWSSAEKRLSGGDENDDDKDDEKNEKKS